MFGCDVPFVVERYMSWLRRRVPEAITSKGKTKSNSRIWKNSQLQTVADRRVGPLIASNRNTGHSDGIPLKPPF
jgi:hypothetical protein